jgi:hypothetical protein
MKRRNWDRARDRDRMRRQGIENARDDAPFALPLTRRRPRRPLPTKAELRAQSAAALASFSGPKHVAVCCRACGHQGTVMVSIDAVPAFRCSKCGARAP